MPRGGKRKGAGAPKGNQNALQHGGRAKVRYGVPLDVPLTRNQYRALCMDQLDQLKAIDESQELDEGCISPLYLDHKERYKGAMFFR